MSAKKIELKVNYHVSGRYTLSYRTADGMYTDFKDDGLLSSDDQGRFYRSLVKKVVELASSGYSVSFIDTSDDGDYGMPLPIIIG